MPLLRSRAAARRGQTRFALGVFAISGLMFVVWFVAVVLGRLLLG